MLYYIFDRSSVNHFKWDYAFIRLSIQDCPSRLDPRCGVFLLHMEPNIMKPIKCSNGTVFTSYDNYLESSHWRNIRLRVAKRENYVCQICGVKTKNLFHVHHLNYSRVGNEHSKDLAFLCVPCHNKHHNGSHVIPSNISEMKSWNVPIKKSSIQSSDKAMAKVHTKYKSKKRNKQYSAYDEIKKLVARIKTDELPMLLKEIEAEIVRRKPHFPWEY